ncbi:MAG TPA: hypothetical protein VN541_07045 [Tepidisphaeraceae bacterium]|nr:hypothetical protein [Tepidisphaeraceae bacterium]
MSTTILSGIWPWVMRRGLSVGVNGAESVPAETSATMQRWVRVKIDMERLRSHLTPETRQRSGEPELRKWLVRSGFQPQGEWWLVPETLLGQLGPSEVQEAEPVEI